MIPPHTIIEIACTQEGATPAEFIGTGRYYKDMQCKYVAYVLLKKYSNFTNRRIAFIMNRSETAISKSVSYINRAINEPYKDVRQQNLCNAINHAEVVISANKLDQQYQTHEN